MAADLFFSREINHRFVGAERRQCDAPGAGRWGARCGEGGRGGGGQELVTNLLDLVSQHHRLPDGINKYMSF